MATTNKLQQLTRATFNSILLILLVLLTQNVLAQDSFSDKANALLNNAVNQNEVVGISAGYSIKGEIKWQGGSGLQNKDQNSVFTDLTITRLASIAKTMTAVAILQLFEQGKIDLDAPIQNYISDFPVKKEGSITTRHLLNHTSGIGEYASKKEAQNMVNYQTMAEAVNLFKDRDLVNSPGKGFQYTSYGYDVLGLIIENVSGLSYENYIAEFIWKPSGMTRTSIEKFGQVYADKADLFHRNSKGKIKAAKVTNLSDRIPAGGIQSCVGDILKFGDAVLAHTLISESSFEMMIADPKIRAKEAGNGYGMGIYLYGDNDQFGKVVGHSGAQIGCSSFMFLLPEVNTSVVVLSNTSGAGQLASDTGVKLFYLAGESQKDLN